MDITSVDKLLLAVVFLIPGFVAMKVYSVLTSSERLDASKALVDALAFSCLTYAAFSWAILWVREVQLAAFHPVWFGVFCVALLFIAPAIAAVALFAARRLRSVARWLPHPVGKPWDFVFSRREQAYVIVTLNSGRRIGGFYGGESFASSHPYEEQIFIETVWDIDDEQGFKEKHTRSRGMMISGANIETIEFIGLYDDDEQRQADAGNRERRVSTNGAKGVSTDQQGGRRVPAAEEHRPTSSAAGTQE
ncbi:DUF6338 family protein [Paraburkholderia silviterrae]|uniref:Uncharacterized protein n=1 Tax=Paraburkholderia silviterrae TaxID=2528715 RepID=A0A4R5ME36_9BURK|nr:DUF6338 family protein [Paraburkholderia silviterrae]TDG25134.1 hypothetical protein EYW47_04530 [Paraburkholderia silviterrae]